MPRRKFNKEQLQAVIRRRSPRFLSAQLRDPEDPITPKPQRNSGEGHRPAVILRKSPRFLSVQHADQEDPITPKPNQQKNRAPWSVTPLTLTGNKKVSSRRGTRKPKLQECLQTLDESSAARKNADGDPKTGLRRSTRLSRPHSSNGRNHADKNAEKTGHGGFTGHRGNESKEGVGKSDHFKEESLKNKVKHRKKNINKGVLSVVEKSILDEGLTEKCMDKKTNVVGATTAIVEHGGAKEGRDIPKARKLVGVKRKRNQVDGGVGVNQSWTKDQELALERAYLNATPTPHFWKKVSRLVPGKSAQECFDKVHCSHLTPPQPQPRSRPRILNSHKPSMSASKLLDSESPKAKKPRRGRQKSHVLHRTVRHMLQKQSKTEQDSEMDLFSVLEPTFGESTHLFHHVVLTTPLRNQDNSETFKGSRERSSLAAHKKSLSRFSSQRAPLVSPPVLKQVKNKALHEKYIDQLHCREAIRKAASAKLHRSKGVKRESPVQRKDAIEAAKNALVFDARDAINEFQLQQFTALSDFVDEEEGEDLL